MKKVLNNLGETTLVSIPPELRDFLIEIDYKYHEDEASIPVYYQDGDQILFIKDYEMSNNKEFERYAPKDLWRGGGILLIKTREGVIVLYDERNKWLKLPGGVARFSEGRDLSKASIREGMIEEISVTNSDERFKLVPKNLSLDVDLNIDSWGITTKEIRSCGELTVIGTFFNTMNRCVETVTMWDLSRFENELKFFHNEDWHAGGRTGFVPTVIDKYGQIMGIYGGRHGFIAYPVPAGGIKIHPTLQIVLESI